MAKSTSVFCNHSLNTNTVQELAKNISNKLNVNVIYGYTPNIIVNECEKSIHYDYQNADFIELETITFPNASKTYYLKDCSYGEKFFLERYGTEILDNKEYKIAEDLKEAVLKDSNRIEFELLEKQNNCFDTLAYIYKNVVDLWFEEFLDWWYFQRAFVYFMDEGDCAYINDWRVKNKKWVDRLGGNFMFVFSLEEKSAEVLDWFEQFDQEHVFNEIKDKYKNTLVNIPNYLLSKNYLSAPVYEPKYVNFDFWKKFFYAIKNDLNLNPIDLEYPILFYDDFYDLRKTFDLKKRAFDFVYSSSHIQENERKQQEFHDNLNYSREIVPKVELSKYFKLCHVFLSGYKHYHSLHLWFQLKINQEVYLVRETQNKYDKHAIAVYADACDDWKLKEKPHRKIIGYIPKNDNYILSKLLDNGYKTKALIKKLSDEEVERNNYKWAIQIEIFSEATSFEIRP